MSFLLTVMQGTGRGDGVEILPRIYLDADDLRRTRHGTHMAVAGSGRLGDRFVGRAADLDDDALIPQLEDHPEDLMMSIAGSLAVVVHAWGSRAVHVVADPLGGQPVFRLGGPGDVAVLIGSDAAQIVETARRLGIPVQPSGMHVSELVLTGNAGFGGLSYKELGLLPQFSTARITTDTIDVKQHPQPWHHGADSPVALDSDPYWAAVEDIADDIRRNIQAVAEYPALARVAHLTGGFDSRLVLAGIMNRERTEEFGFFCSGTPTQTDKRVSLGLERSLGLRSAERSGISAARYPSSLEEEILWPMTASGGLRTDGPTEHTHSFDTVVLSGGYGEILRSFYSRVNVPGGLEDVSELCRTIWGRAATDPAHPSCFLTPAAVDDHGRAVQASLSSAVVDGVREDYLLDHMYVTLRNRFYVGLSSALYSKYVHRFDPLYSVAAVRLASRLPVDVRHENFVGLDVMTRLAPSLLAYEFDTPRISQRYRSLRTVAEPKPFLSGSLAGSKVQPVPYRTPQQGPIAYAPHPTSAQIAQANAMKASLRHVVQIDRVRTELATLAGQLRGTDTEHYIDLDKLHRATAQKPTNRVVMRSMFSSYSALLWFAQTQGVQS